MNITNEMIERAIEMSKATIELEDDVLYPVINKKLCIGCGACVQFCENDSVKLDRTIGPIVHNWDKYIIEGTNVLKNKLGITDKETLEQKEKELVLPHLAFLHLNPILTVPSAEGLKDIHQFLFSDLYSWAGQYRTCTLRKNTYNFTDPSLIEEELKSVIERYSNEIDRVQTKDEYAFVLAPFYYDLIRVHPFREGNERSSTIKK